MALSPEEERRLINMVNGLSDSKRDAVMSSEGSLKKWLKKAARWLWEKFTNTIVGNIINWFFGLW